MMDFHKPVLNELGQEIGYLDIALRGSLTRFATQDEHMVRKIEVFKDKLASGEMELDEADLILFRQVVMASDAIQGAKIMVLKILDGQ